jgi:hypothetical protein
MRKTLRALFLGTALAASAIAPTLAQTPGMPQGPRPPNAEQQQQYEQLRAALLRQLQLDEPQVHALEALEDSFYAGAVTAADYQAQRAAMLRAMYPELANDYEEFSGSRNRLLGCTADGYSVTIPVVTMVRRADMDALFDRLSGGAQKAQNGTTVRYINTITDMSNILRQQMEKISDDMIAKVTMAELRSPQHLEKLNQALADAATRAARDAHVDLQVRPVGLQTLEVSCRLPVAPTPAPATPQP